MAEDVYGVFFQDGYEEYLFAAFETEEEAWDYAAELDKRIYEEALDKARDSVFPVGEPEWDDFAGMHYVQPIARDLVDYSLLDRGFAQSIRY
jgi:hypothetical protein